MELAYDRSGSGEPLVLLHGVGHRRQGWEPVLDLLVKHREVITVDLPGHGESPVLPVDLRGHPDSVTDAVMSFLDELGLDRPHVAGNSLGGLISLELGSREVVRSVTALSPAGFASRLELRHTVAALRFATRLGAHLTRARAEWLVRNPVTRVALFGLMFGRPSRHDPDELVDEMLRYGEPNDTFDQILSNAHTEFDFTGRPFVRTTVGWGTRDLVFPRWQGMRLRRQIPGAAVYFLPGCGHVPMADDPDLVADLLLTGSREVEALTGQVG